MFDLKEKKNNNKNNNKINRIEVKKMKEQLKLRSFANLAKTTETKIEPLGQNLFKGQKLSVNRFCTPVKH